MDRDAVLFSRESREHLGQPIVIKPHRGFQQTEKDLSGRRFEKRFGHEFP
jgi:hypothetical protein